MKKFRFSPSPGKRSSSSFLAHYPSPSRFSLPTPTRGDFLMVETFELAEPIILKWDPESSTYAKVTSLFYENRREALEFIKRVKSLHRAMFSLVSENSNSDLLVRAQHLMQVAMKRMEKEFYQILSLNRAQLDPESVSTRSSRTSTLSSLSDFVDESDDEARAAETLITEVEDSAERVMTDLKLIAECMTSCGYGKECVKIFNIIRKSIVDEGIYKLGVEKQKHSHIQKMDWEVLDLKIKNWLDAVKIAVKTLFHGERILCDHVFASSDSIRQSCFTEITREGASILFGFPENVMKNSRKSPEKIFRLLDMYTTIAELWPEIESVFSFSSTSSTSPVVNLALTQLIKLAESIRLGLTEFESSLHKESSKAAVAGAGVPKLTIDTMNYLSLLADYSVLPDILLDSPPLEKMLSPVSFFDEEDSEKSPAPAGSATLRLAWLILVLICKLDSQAKHYKDVSHAYLFLANNLQHIISEVRSSNLRRFLGDDWIAKRESKVNQFAEKYENLAWSHVIAAVPENPDTLTLEAARESFKKLNAVFDDANRKQSAVVVPDSKLRAAIKLSIARKLLPAYREFYDAQRTQVARERKFAGVVKYAPEDMGNALSDLFFSAGNASTSTSVSSTKSSSHSRTSKSHR